MILITEMEKKHLKEFGIHNLSKFIDMRKFQLDMEKQFPKTCACPICDRIEEKLNRELFS